MASRHQRDQEFTAFARARVPALTRTAWMLTGDSQKAEDLVQETLIKVYAQWGPRIDNPAAYAQTTLTRTWISQMRRRSSHETPVADLPERTRRDTDHSLRVTLAAALDRLDPLDRAIVVLRHLDDVSTEDTAHQVGLSSGAVRNRLKRALARLRVDLDLPFHEMLNDGVPS